jgi:hypothetical protein
MNILFIKIMLGISRAGHYAESTRLSDLWLYWVTGLLTGTVPWFSLLDGHPTKIVGWPSSREHQGTVPVNRSVTQYNHKSESLVLSVWWPARGIPNSILIINYMLNLATLRNERLVNIHVFLINIFYCWLSDTVTLVTKLAWPIRSS